MQRETAKSKLQTVLNNFLDLKTKGHLFAPSDLAFLESLWPTDAMPICFMNIHPFSLAKSTFVPALSFYLKNGETHHFQNMSNFRDFVRYNFDVIDLTAVESCANIIAKSQFYYILTYRKVLHTARDREILCRIIDEYCQSSLYLLNIEQDHYRLYYKKSYQMISTSKSYVSSVELPTILNKITAFRSSLLYSSPFNHFFLNPKQQDTEIIEEIKYVYADYQHQDSILRFTLDAGSASNALRSAASYGKPQFFEQHLTDDEKLYILLFPVFNYSKFVKTSQPHAPIKVELEDGSARELVREVLFIISSSPFSKPQVMSISAVIDAYTQYRFSDSRLDLIRSHRSKLMDLAKQYLQNYDLRYSTLQRHFSELSTAVLQDILVSTSAHSATVRLYDHGTRSLVAVAQVNDVEGEYDPGAWPSKIRIAENRFTSVNVFSYLNFQTFPFIHLPHVYQDVGQKRGVKQKTRFNIPKKYAKFKLRAPLTVRRSTRAEICFALCYNAVPVGTLNLESPLPYSFDHDIEYLFLLKSELEQAFEKTIAYTDVRTQDYQIQTYAAVHELNSYVRLKFFTQNQADVLESLFPLRRLDVNVDRIAFNLRGSLDRWIDEIYNEQSERSRSDIKSLIFFRSFDEQRLSHSKLNALFFIIKNMLLNIVSHGDDRNSRIIIDDSPYYKSGGKWEVRVFCTFCPVPDADTLDRLCVAPIQSESGYRHGMFLVGIMTKVSGGFFYVERSPGRSSSSILIRLPYGKGLSNEIHQDITP